MNDEKKTSAISDQVTPAAVTSRKVTNRKPDHKTATANLRIHGICLLCTNARDNTVDIGIFEHGHTPVCICIDSPGGRVSFSCEDHVKYTIVIERAKPKAMGEFYEHPASRDSDTEDFRWMPDLLVMHPGGAETTEGTRHMLSAKLVIRDGIYYTRLRSANPATLIDTTGHAPEVEDYVGRVLGVDLTCDPNDPKDDRIFVRVFEEGNPTPVFDPPLPRSEGPYAINIETLSLDPNEDHMPMLYHVINVKETSRFSLRYNGEGWIQYCDCNGTSEFVGFAEERVFFKADAPEVSEVPEEKRVEFKSFQEAVDAGFTMRRRSDQYACQVIPGGEGPILFP